MSAELNQHQLARLCLIVCKAYGPNGTSGNPYAIEEAMTNTRMYGISITSISRNSVGCKYRSKKYSFTFVNYTNKNFFIQAREYFTSKIHYILVGVLL